MSSLRYDFGLTSRNDSFLVRVKRSNSFDNWSYNPVPSRTSIISSVPDSPRFPPFKNALSTLNKLVISVKTLY